MEENRFFRIVWRCNAIVLLLAGVMTVGVLSYAGYEMVKSVTRTRSTHNVVNMEQSSKGDEQYTLSELKHISGGNHVMLTLESNQDIDSGYYSKSARSERNYLFIDAHSGETRWLFPDNRQIITETRFFETEKTDKGEGAVKAILYHVIKSDSTGDGRLTRNDVMSVALSRANGEGYKELISEVDTVVGCTKVDDNTAMIVYERNHTGYSALLDLNTLELGVEREVVMVGATHQDR